MRIKRQLAWVALLAFVGWGTAQAQGVQTGQITGVVKTADGAVVPGANVSLRSPALLGVRTAVTDATGAYLFRGLAPGEYTVTIELSGMSTVEQKTTVGVDTVGKVDATLRVANVKETVTVTAEAQDRLNTTEVGANYGKNTIDLLPVQRDPADVATLAPGLTDHTPNGGQVTIAGGFAYDNVFLVDGTDVDDNLFGSPQNLFIEDAIQETQVLTSGISAEYGRFSGGVVNVVTKRGGNDFTGSFRADLTNPTWTTATPFDQQSNAPRVSNLNKAYEATLGGPVVKDRLWFFTAGRLIPTESTANTLADSGIPFTTTTEEKRFEGKLTGAITPNHTISAQYTFNNFNGIRFPFGTTGNNLREIDPRDVFPAASEPNNLFVVNYNGVLSPKLFAEVQYSQRHFEFSNEGGTNTSIVDGSPFFTVGATTNPFGQYNAPYFDATDPEDRNNRQFAASLSYFLSTNSFGRHDLKGGWENFRSTRIGGNSQTPSGFVFYDDYVQTATGSPLVTDGRIQPNWVPGLSQAAQWLPVRGARIDVTTNSFYLNDKWQVNSHFSANLGVRYESVKSVASGGIIGVDTSTWVPRLAVSFDPMGNGEWKLNGTFAWYAGKYNEAQIGNNTNVGNPNAIFYLYNGPAGQGLNFAPGFNLANYQIVGGFFPIANAKFAPGLSSPISKEFTFSLGKNLGGKGFAQLTYTHRNWSNFIEDFVTHDLGTTTVVQDGTNFGTFDNVLYQNSDIPVRYYDGIQFQASYRISDRWNVTANYTRQINNYGNYDGENTNQPAITSLIGNYPEIYVPSRDFPEGNLADYVPNRIRSWTTYDLGLGSGGDILLGLLWRYDSGGVFSYVAQNFPISAQQLANNPGYATPPAVQNLYFGARGAGTFPGYHVFDLSATYNIKVFKSLKPYFKADVLNLFNNQDVIEYNTTVRADPNSPLDANGLPTGFIKGSKFGLAQSNGAYPASTLLDGTVKNARTFEVALGFRF
jgi:hypothetical protein